MTFLPSSFWEADLRSDVVAVEAAGGALLRWETPSCLGWKQDAFHFWRGSCRVNCLRVWMTSLKAVSKQYGSLMKSKTSSANMLNNANANTVFSCNLCQITDSWLWNVTWNTCSPVQCESSRINGHKFTQKSQEKKKLCRTSLSIFTFLSFFSVTVMNTLLTGAANS